MRAAVRRNPYCNYEKEALTLDELLEASRKRVLGVMFCVITDKKHL